MFTAIDNHEKRVSIENVIEGLDYYCPVCKELLTIKAKNSQAIKTHFAHRRGKFCIDDWQHDMSEWHYEWQSRFPMQNREVVLEKDGIKHRADICINNTVIEFQHSPISGDEIYARNKFYMSCGYKVVWVFDVTDKIKNFVGVSIDPMDCTSNDLCWKRAKSQFQREIDPRVSIYLQYKTYIKSKEYKDRQFDVLLYIQKIDSRNIVFKPTVDYILPINFLKEYGVCPNIINGIEILSVTDIINKTEHYIRKKQMKRVNANLYEQFNNLKRYRQNIRKPWL